MGFALFACLFIEIGLFIVSVFLKVDLCVKIQFKWEICNLPFHICLENTPELMFIDPSSVSVIMGQNFLSLRSFQGSHFPSVQQGNSSSLGGSVERGAVKILIY